MSDVIAHEQFVLVGAVPLFAVTNLTLNEGYKLPPIGKGDKSQWLGKAEYSVTIQGMLIGPDRLLYKVALEALADLSMVLPSLVPIPGLGGIPLVSGLTTLPDMQITSLRFTQTSQEFGAIGVNVSLKHCPRGFVAELIGRGTNMASSLVAGGITAATGTRTTGTPFG